MIVHGYKQIFKIPEDGCTNDAVLIPLASPTKVKLICIKERSIHGRYILDFYVKGNNKIKYINGATSTGFIELLNVNKDKKYFTICSMTTSNDKNFIKFLIEIDDLLKLL